jgi:hypothetical protein
LRKPTSEFPFRFFKSPSRSTAEKKPVDPQQPAALRRDYLSGAKGERRGPRTSKNPFIDGKNFAPRYLDTIAPTMERA